MAYGKGFQHGLTAGLVIGILLAPRPGRQTRDALGRSYQLARSRSQGAAAALQRGWRTAQPAVAGAVRVARPAARGAGERLLELTGQARSGPGEATGGGAAEVGRLGGNVV